MMMTSTLKSAFIAFVAFSSVTWMAHAQEVEETQGLRGLTRVRRCNIELGFAVCKEGSVVFEGLAASLPDCHLETVKVFKAVGVHGGVQANTARSRAREHGLDCASDTTTNIFSRGEDFVPSSCSYDIEGYGNDNFGVWCQAYNAGCNFLESEGLSRGVALWQGVSRGKYPCFERNNFPFNTLFDGGFGCSEEQDAECGRVTRGPTPLVPTPVPTPAPTPAPTPGPTP